MDIVEIKKILSLPVRGAWIEICLGGRNECNNPSLPVRGAWIEISDVDRSNGQIGVAPCEGSVD